MSEKPKHLTRRDLLKLGALAGAPFLLKKEAQSEPEPPQWKEISPLTQAGAELLGVVTEEAGSKDVVETRAYDLPKNPDFNGHLVAMSSRKYPKGMSGDDFAVHEYGGMGILVLPTQVKAAPAQGDYDKTLRFGRLELGVKQQEEGYTRIWESEFYYKGQRLPYYSNGISTAYIQHLGKSDVYQPRHAFFMNAELGYDVLTPHGVVSRNGKELVFEVGNGRWSSVPVPDAPEGTDLENITVVRANGLVLVKGLTKEPYSVIAEPRIPDGLYWDFIPQDTGTLNLFRKKEFMNKVIELSMKAEVTPENMQLVTDIIQHYSQMWGNVLVGIQTTWKEPFLSKATGETYLGEPVVRTDYNLNAVATELSVEAREAVVPIKSGETDTSPIPIIPRQGIDEEHA